MMDQIQWNNTFVNGTHFGYGDEYVYSTQSWWAFAVYGSIVLSVAVVAWSLWILCTPLPRRGLSDSTKTEVLLEKRKKELEEKQEKLNPYARIDALLDKFRREVQQSEVLVYDEEALLEEKKKPADDSQGPPVVDGFYSLTQDDPSLDYNEDMYLEFLEPSSPLTTGCVIHGYGKYDTGNVRVEGLVASTGEAYWYEVPYDSSHPSPPPVVLARGIFSRLEDNSICFKGKWYHANGEHGGEYCLFSHKVAFPANCPSVAESMTVMECSFSGSVLESMEGSLKNTGSVIEDLEGAIDILEQSEADPPAVVVLDRTTEGRRTENTEEEPPVEQEAGHTDDDITESDHVSDLV